MGEEQDWILWTLGKEAWGLPGRPAKVIRERRALIKEGLSTEFFMSHIEGWRVVGFLSSWQRISHKAVLLTIKKDLTTSPLQIKALSSNLLVQPHGSMTATAAPSIMFL